MVQKFIVQNPLTVSLIKEDSYIPSIQRKHFYTESEFQCDSVNYYALTNNNNNCCSFGESESFTVFILILRSCRLRIKLLDLPLGLALPGLQAFQPTLISSGTTPLWPQMSWSDLPLSTLAAPASSSTSAGGVIVGHCRHQCLLSWCGRYGEGSILRDD